MGIRFHKMHGLGNDFIIIDTRQQPLRLSTKLVTQLCDRHFGVGCDQLVLLEAASREESTIRVQFFQSGWVGGRGLWQCFTVRRRAF